MQRLPYSLCSFLPEGEVSSFGRPSGTDATSHAAFRGIAVRALLINALVWLTLALWVLPANADRVKDVASFSGVRANQLVGYGVVVGLDNTGDTSAITSQALGNLMGNLGVTPGSTVSSKNAASVMVTASLPAFAKPGQAIDVTVSALGGSKSLRGGTLLVTPLKGLDGQIYAMAQGNLMVGGAGASSGGASAQVNHLSAGRIPGGATVERSVPTRLGQGEYVQLELRDADFTTAARVLSAIDAGMGKGLATAVDGRLIQVKAPLDPTQRVAFLAALENLSLNPATASPRVIINPRTGSIVMNQMVTVDKCAVAHGNLSITISSDPQVSQPNALAGGETVVTAKSDVQIKSDKGELLLLPVATSLSDVVKALNAVGATPQDLLAILQAMKAAGALKAELEVI